MAAIAKQLDQVNAALADLQEEMKEETKKVNRAEERLEKAILEGKPFSPFEKLLESASANFTGLQRKEEKLLEFD